jgi:hypothetical protein
LRESYISFSPSAGFLEANKIGILESSDFTWTYYGLSGKVKSPLTPPKSRSRKSAAEVRLFSAIVIPCFRLPIDLPPAN